MHKAFKNKVQGCSTPLKYILKLQDRNELDKMFLHTTSSLLDSHIVGHKNSWSKVN